jgi:hypothetical protein
VNEDDLVKRLKSLEMSVESIMANAEKDAQSETNCSEPNDNQSKKKNLWSQSKTKRRNYVPLQMDLNVNHSDTNFTKYINLRFSIENKLKVCPYELKKQIIKDT